MPRLSVRVGPSAPTKASSYLPFLWVEGCPSGQWERTVNPSAYAYAGSNPAPSTTKVLSSLLWGCQKGSPRSSAGRARPW